MTKTNMNLSELLAKHDQGDFLRSIAEAVLQLMMEADVEGLIGAGRHERSGERTTWRNGYDPPTARRRPSSWRLPRTRGDSPPTSSAQSLG
ncbi:mutator family transposase [Rhodovulum steppense]|uniref:Mutator family transposase n=1 Tax=Rhodovulum steppense TaxID=540251 RepID=A0A4R1YIV3_9RHOB|nr:mutator family transposase [Rhodovulum steppense]